MKRVYQFNFQKCTIVNLAKKYIQNKSCDHSLILNKLYILRCIIQFLNIRRASYSNN